MKMILTVFVVSAILASVLATASAEGVLDLSTLGKNTAQQATALPQLSPTMPTATSEANTTQQVTALPQVSPAMPTTAPLTLGGNVKTNVLDLSTLGKKQVTPLANMTMIKGPNPTTVTPMFSIRNANITTVASTIFTLPQAVGSNEVYTPPIAIFGGA